jgi:hypothetical protein
VHETVIQPVTLVVTHQTGSAGHGRDVFAVSRIADNAATVGGEIVCLLKVLASIGVVSVQPAARRAPSLLPWPASRRRWVAYCDRLRPRRAFLRKSFKPSAISGGSIRISWQIIQQAQANSGRAIGSVQMLATEAPNAPGAQPDRGSAFAQFNATHAHLHQFVEIAGPDFLRAIRHGHSRKSNSDSAFSLSQAGLPKKTQYLRFYKSLTRTDTTPNLVWYDLINVCLCSEILNAAAWRLWYCGQRPSRREAARTFEALVGTTLSFRHLAINGSCTAH